MTDQTNADLIAELRGFAAGSESARASLMRDAADRLEAAEKRAEEAERDLEELSDDLDHHVKGHMAEYERATGLAAVVEKVREYVSDLHSGSCHDVLAILDSAPQDALREVKAADGEWNYEHEAMIEDGGVSLLDNPYRARGEQDRG